MEAEVNDAKAEVAHTPAPPTNILPTEALQSAIVNFDTKRVEQLLSEGLDVKHTYIDRVSQRNALHELALCYTAYQPWERPANINVKFIELMTLFLRAGLDINAADVRKQTVLHLLASVRGCHDVMKVVMASRNVKVNARDAGHQTALHKAAQTGNLIDVITLLDGGADPNLMDSVGYTPMHVATKKKCGAEVIQLLVKCGGSVNQQEVRRNRCGSTPLHLAASFGHVNNVDALLRLGAETTRRDGAGKTPLHVAAAHDVTGDIVKLLLRSGADVNACDTVYGESALHVAVSRRMFDAVKHLTRANANPNATSELRNTALHVAASTCRDLSVWTHLMRLGGRPDVTNSDGQTPRTLAVKMKNYVATAVIAQYTDR